MFTIIQILELLQSRMINIDFFAYEQANAIDLMQWIKKKFQVNHIYLTVEGVRYYVRGIVWSISADQSSIYNQIFQLADYYNCCSDFYAGINYRMAG